MSIDVIKNLKPEILWQRFYEISQVPRPSKKEEKIIEFSRKFFNKHNISFKEDKVGNIIAKLPATKGYENSPVVVLQAHVDMVCEKNKGTEFDFENDPIKLKEIDGWITAEGTTLGADNGIGMAAALAVVSDESVLHGPIEILLTVDEETGLTGANFLEPGFVEGSVLLNMDSEEDGAFYIGCAGGIDTVGSFKIENEDVLSGTKAYQLLVTGLSGGHSGLEIHIGKANAIKFLGRLLKKLDEVPYQLASIEGGSKRNAIPREAEAVILIKPDDEEKVKNIITLFEKDALNEFKRKEPAISIKLINTDETFKNAFSSKLKHSIINTILGLPHGVMMMSADIPELVETSTNLATITRENGVLKIGTSQRSFIESAKYAACGSVKAIMELAGAEVAVGDGYPSWKPNVDSDVLKLSKEVFKKTFNTEPEIKAIHAGLECGILGSKYPQLDMISFGPTITGAHSPDEKIEISTVDKFYTLLKGVLKELAEKK